MYQFKTALVSLPTSRVCVAIPGTDPVLLDVDDTPGASDPGSPPLDDVDVAGKGMLPLLVAVGLAFAVVVASLVKVVVAAPVPVPAPVSVSVATGFAELAAATAVDALAARLLLWLLFPPTTPPTTPPTIAPTTTMPPTRKTTSHVRVLYHGVGATPPTRPASAYVYPASAFEWSTGAVPGAGGVADLERSAWFWPFSSRSMLYPSCKRYQRCFE